MNLVGRESKAVVGSEFYVFLSLSKQRAMKLDVDPKNGPDCGIDHPVVGIRSAGSIILNGESMVSESPGGQRLEVLFGHRTEHHLCNTLPGSSNTILCGFPFPQPFVEVPGPHRLDPTPQIILRQPRIRGNVVD